MNYDPESCQPSNYATMSQRGTDNFDLAAVTNKFLSKHDTKISIF